MEQKMLEKDQNLTVNGKRWNEGWSMEKVKDMSKMFITEDSIVTGIKNKRCFDTQNDQSVKSKR